MDKNIKHAYIILVIIIFVFGFLFYWFQIRPIRIRLYCVKLASYANKKALEQTQEKYKGYLPDAEFMAQCEEKNYQRCLRNKGL